MDVIETSFRDTTGHTHIWAKSGSSLTIDVKGPKSCADPHFKWNDD